MFYGGCSHYHRFRFHFLYNSAVFSTLSTNPYTAAVVLTDFLTGTSFKNVSTASLSLDRVDVDVQTLTALRDNQSGLEYLSNAACLKTYRNELLPDRLDVLVVSSATNAKGSLLSYWPDNVPIVVYNSPMHALRNPPYSWTCTQTGPDRCDPPTQNWTVLGSPIEYCLSKRTEPSCKFQVSVVIMVTVILCNFVKTLCMSLIVWKPSSKPSSMPLLNLGDAIATFLDQPDPNTANDCLASKYSFRGATFADLWYATPTLRSQRDPHFSNFPCKEWPDGQESTSKSWLGQGNQDIQTRYRWYHATGQKHWFLCIAL